MADKSPIEYKLHLKNVRLSFNNLRRVYEKSGKYGARFLLDKDEQADQIAMINRAIDKCMKEKLDISKMPAGHRCLRDGDEVETEGYDNTMYLQAANDKVTIYTRKLNPKTGRPDPISAEDAEYHPDEPYSGCYVNAIVGLWAQKKRTLPDGETIPNRINANLYGVQMAAHGEAFGRGNVDVSDEFDAVEVDENEESAFGAEDDSDDSWDS